MTDPTTPERIRGFRAELAIAGGQRGALAVSAARKPRRRTRVWSRGGPLGKTLDHPPPLGKTLDHPPRGGSSVRARAAPAHEPRSIGRRDGGGGRPGARGASAREPRERQRHRAGARALAEKAEREARVGMAAVAARHRAAERAERSLRSSPVKSAVKQAMGARLAESRRRCVAAHKTPARSRLEDRPDFDLNFTARRSEETPDREAFSPIAVRYPDGSPGASFNVADEAAAARARARSSRWAAAAAEAAEAANRRLAAAEMSVVRVRNSACRCSTGDEVHRGTPGGTPGGGGSAGSEARAQLGAREPRVAFVTRELFVGWEVDFNP